MGAERGLVERGELHAEVVDVAAALGRRAAAEATERRVDDDEVDEAGARAELHEAERVDAALLAAAERGAVEAQRALEVDDAQDHVVEPLDVDRTHAAMLAEALLAQAPHAARRDAARRASRSRCRGRPRP